MNARKTSTEFEMLQNEDKSTVVGIAFLFILFLILYSFYEKGNSQKEKKTVKYILRFKNNLAKEYRMKTDTLLALINRVIEEGDVKKVISSDVKKLPEELIYLCLGKPVAGKNYSKAALADACHVSRNVLSNRLKKIDWSNNFELTISKEDYKKMRMLSPRIFESLKNMHDLYYPHRTDILS